MRHATVRDWMTRVVVTVREDETLRRAIQVMHERGIQRVPVVDAEGHLVGMLSASDVRGVAPFSSRGRPLTDFEAILEEYQVDEQMSRNPVTIGPERRLSDALRYFLKGKFGALPVLEDGALIGILTVTDALQAFLEVLEGEGADARSRPAP